MVKKRKRDIGSAIRGKRNSEGEGNAKEKDDKGRERGRGGKRREKSWSRRWRKGM